jgi:hypothetical protein
VKTFNPLNWYWIVGGNTAQVYASKPALRDYVPVADPDFAAWNVDTPPTEIESEASLGAVLAPYQLRPIPQGILAGYLDAQMIEIVLQPEFKLWLDLYASALHPTPDETQIRARIRSKL